MILIQFTLAFNYYISCSEMFFSQNIPFYQNTIHALFIKMFPNFISHNIT